MINGSAGIGGSPNPILINCIFNGNSTDRFGGGMYNIDSSPIVDNCTFTGNVAERGGGIYSDRGNSPALTNCILWNNSAGGVDDEAHLGPKELGVAVHVDDGEEGVPMGGVHLGDTALLQKDGVGRRLLVRVYHGSNHDIEHRGQHHRDCDHQDGPYHWGDRFITPRDPTKKGALDDAYLLLTNQPMLRRPYKRVGTRLPTMKMNGSMSYSPRPEGKGKKKGMGDELPRARKSASSLTGSWWAGWSTRCARRPW